MSRACGLLTALVGGLVLAGWTLGIPRLQSFSSSLGAMAPNTAVCFVGLGRALALLSRAGPSGRNVIAAVAASVIVVAAATLSQDVIGRDLGIDQLLVTDRLGVVRTTAPGRMAPATAVIFMLQGLALFLLARRRAPRIAQLLCLLSGGLSLIALAGHAYDVRALYSFGPFSGIALHTAPTFFVLTLGLLTADREHGVMALFGSDTAGGLMARRLLPLAIGVPILLGWLRVAGQRAGFFEENFGNALFAVAAVGFTAVLIVWNGFALARLDQERRRAEEALRRSEERTREAQKMEAVGRLAGGVAHDFNNILTAILGYSDLLLGLGPHDQETTEGLAEIRRASERAAALTRQLLAFSRKQLLSPQVFDLDLLVEELRSMLRRLIGENIAIVTKRAEAPALIHADRGQVEQVIVNLAINARDAMPGGGTLTIETSRGESQDAGVTLTVRDTGVGMSPEAQEHIFEPFYTTKERGRGTGLGLATVYGIVTQSGGSIRVESEPGNGTMMRVTFPSAAEEAVASPAPAPLALPAVEPSSETVLLVEDEDALRALARKTLVQRGYQVLDASDGFHALEVVAGHRGRLDLVVTDVVMPRMGGKELADRLKRSHPGLPVLFMSGYTDGTLAEQGVLPAGTPLLQKPFLPAVLAREVRRLLDQKTSTA